MERNGSSRASNPEDRDRASTAYLAWPLAIIGLTRPPADQTLWLRAHLRQALILGILVTAGTLTVLALPLFVVIGLGGPDATTTIRVYATFLVLDLLAVGAAIVLSLRCAMRANRGDLFDLPLVSALVSRLFPTAKRN